MKKIGLGDGVFLRPACKFLLLMKLSFLLVLACCLQASATAYSQERFSFSFEQVSLDRIFSHIQKTGHYRFFYNDGYVKKLGKTDLRANNATLPEILDQLTDKGLSYRIMHNNMVVISPAATINAQIAIKGQVKDVVNGQPLPGVTVKVKGASTGTITNESGEFSLVVPDDAILVVSFIGYENREIPVAGKKQVDILLQPSASGLNEVVVVGYGTEKKANVIGSVSQVTSKDIENRQVTTLSTAITGQMPGVTVIQRSGRPGYSAGSINIRGVGSFGALADPLVLVDGIQVSSFNDIDPNDVESMSVLKDASSAAIYGARAANGVILVTTKSGRQGKMKISYNGYVGVQKPTAFPETVSAWEYATLYNEALGREVYTASDIQKYKDGSDPDHFPNTNFVDKTFTGSGIQTGHNLSASGGNDKTQYLFSLGYLNQAGIVPENYFNKYSVRMNVTSQLASKLRLTARLAGIKTNVEEPAPPATLDFNDMLTIISQAVRYPAVYGGRFSNGSYDAGPVLKGTPVSWLDSDSRFKAANSNVNINLRLDWDVLKDLRLSMITGYEEFNQRDKRFLASQQLNPQLLLGPSLLQQGTVQSAYKTIQGLAEYNKQLNKHQLGILLGYSFEDRKEENIGASRNNFPGNDLTELNVGAPDNQKSTGTGFEWALQSFFGRLKYNYDNRYLLEGVLRYDGSSRFPPDRKFALFPSIAAGWRISEEQFLKNKFSWLNDLKLKSSIGILGNQNLQDAAGNQIYYPYQNTMAPGKGYPFGGNMASGAARVYLTDPTLHWESTRTFDAGLETSLFNGMLNASITYFDRFTYDILYDPGTTISKVIGFTSSLRNMGKLKNTGWEFMAGHKNKIGDVSYNVTGNFSIINNKVTDLGLGNITQPNGLVGNGSNLFINYPMNAYYGYLTDGLFTNTDDVKNWANQKAINPSSQPGDIRYRDISGPDGKPDGIVDAKYDRVVLGSTIPKYTFGLSLGAGYKGFDLNILLQGVAGVKGRLTNYAGYAFYNTATIQRWMADERWTPANPDRNAKYPRLQSGGTSPNWELSDYWLLNAAYVRVRNIQLGYTVPASLLKKVHADRARFYLSAENPLSFNSYRKGWDPEINTSGNYYPILANYTFGVNISF